MPRPRSRSLPKPKGMEWMAITGDLSQQDLDGQS